MKDIIKIILLYAIKIQFSSNQNYQNKFNHLLDFMNDEIGIFYDRESRVFLQYFKNKNLPIFKKIQKSSIKNKSDFYKKIDNIAWDLFTPRFMEFLMISGAKRQKFFLPMFVSNDTALNDILNIYKINAFYFGRSSMKAGNINISFFNEMAYDYFIKNDINEDKIKKLFDDKEKRKQMRIKTNEELELILSQLFDDCCNIFGLIQ